MQIKDIKRQYVQYVETNINKNNTNINKREYTVK